MLKRRSLEGFQVGEIMPVRPKHLFSDDKTTTMDGQEPSPYP